MKNTNEASQARYDRAVAGERALGPSQVRDLVTPRRIKKRHPWWREEI